MVESGDASRSAPEGAGVVAAGEIGFALRELSQSFRQYDRHLARLMRLKPSEYQAMEHILDGGGVLGPLDLAARLGLAPATTSELLDRLQQLGHVVRDRDPDDGRRVKLAPTRSATAQIVAAISPTVGEVDQLSARFEPDEQEVILRFLREASATFLARASQSD